ncbi:MAG: hypothetical protein VXW22_07795 [Pseudomonadota bacterium]|jgi:hypothetical protein|nr:hypothetical protein [Pseudomonadota bacterium]
MEKLRNYLEEEMTPTLAIALACLVALLAYLVIDSFSKSASALESKILDQKAELAQMRVLAEQPALESASARLEHTLDNLTSRLLSEETEGLNAAHFQQLIRLTLQDCGLQNVNLSVVASEDPNVPGLRIYEATVRARDLNRVVALCVRDLSEMDVAANISFIRWTDTGLFQANILGYSEL